MNTKTPEVRVACNVVRESEKAILIRAQDVEDELVEVWIPLSQISDIESIETGDFKKVVTMTKWIAEIKELV